MSELFFSVDIEASGPVPGLFDLLTVGACVTTAPEHTFYRRCRPELFRADPAAMAATGLDLHVLAKDGEPLKQVMVEFEAWVLEMASDALPVFVGFNAPFDWGFINYGFHHHLGRNPFGFTALDIKAFYMGVMGGAWRATRLSEVRRQLNPTLEGDHHALHDALAQAELFELLRQRGAGYGSGE